MKQNLAFTAATALITALMVLSGCSSVRYTCTMTPSDDKNLQYGPAADDCTASLAMRTSGTAYALRGFARLKAGALDSALEDSTNALTLEPKEVMALLVRANVNLAMGHVGEAVADSRKALMIDPAQPWAYVTHGSALAAAGKRDEGLKMLDQAVKMSPGNAEAYLARGKCLASLGRTAEARKDFEKTASLDASLKKTASVELGKLTQ